MIQQSPAKTKSFLKAINKAAMQKCNDIAKQIEETTKAEMARAEDEASRDGHMKIDMAKSKIEAETKLQVAAFETQKKKEIYAKRKAYQEQVFSAAATELKDFTKTEQYKLYIEKCLQNISDKVGANLTFSVAENDTICADAIRARYPDATVLTQAEIGIGGYTLKDEENGILIDDTLDSKLAEQTDWFLLHSGLKVEV
ncbi:MAG: hypothetical protein IKE65_02565 [Clostridia bacterium]|nr:hypothetical protein [Clostridia bacterium]